VIQEPVIRLKTATTEIHGKKLVIKITVTNPSARVLHAYGSIRRLFYNNLTKKLTLYLHDQHLTEHEEKLYSPHLRQPRFVPLEANADTVIKLTMDPVLNRMRSANERGGGPIFEELRVAEATDIDVEIAHQDTPFYYNPSKGNAKQLKDWGAAVSKASFRIPSPLSLPQGGGASAL